MHDQTFPESQESPADRSERAVKALQYEEEHDLGFRRTRGRDASGDPNMYAVTGDIVLPPPSRGEMWGSYAAALAIFLGAGAAVYRPMALGPIAVVLGVFGIIAGGQASPIARIGLIAASIGWTIGCVVAVLFERAII